MALSRRIIILQLAQKIHQLRRVVLLFVVLGTVLVYFLVSTAYIISSQCHNANLWKSESSSDSFDKYKGDDIICKPHRPHPDSCQAANKYFGSPTDNIEPSKCSFRPISDICWFTETYPASLVCSLDFCEDSRIYMTRIDPRYGVIRKWEMIIPFSTDKAFEFVEKSMDQGETFCYIKCAGFVQVIVFPPKVLVNRAVDSTKKVNVNIIVLDSISRAHFYRMMRQSTAAMRDIAQDDSIPATALDFELFQSISMHTFENIRPLFSGIIKGNDNFSSKSSAAQEPLGVDVLFKHYKEHGYQTMFQEDLCWYDEWGIMLDNLERKTDSKPTVERWTKFQNVISKHYLDHVGITHFSCEVFKAYGYSNHYDYPSAVCFQGRYFSSYYLRYLRDLRKALRNVKDAAPMVIYHHFNTPHTSTGTRVTCMDEELAKFIHFAARDSNTWTIILSDHGHTRTEYGLTEEGLLERYNPLLFMIIPNKTAQLMGEDRLSNLESNQKRLITTLDIHGALMALNDEKKKSTTDFKVSGMFSVIPSNRTCSDLPLMPLARCQCAGSEEKLKDNAPAVVWLAEFALGTLNNLIQEQFSKGQSSKSSGVKGFGRCTRLVGKSFRNIIQRKSGSLTTFDLHVDSHGVGLIQDEVFRVAVELKKSLPFLKTYDRQTLYNKFKDCVDGSVELKLCACDKRKQSRNSEKFSLLKTAEMKSLVSSSMFASNTKVQDLHEGCLFQITRYHPSKMSVVYELANSCVSKTFNVKVKGLIYFVILSRTLPMEFLVNPNTIHFMFSGVRQILNHSHLDVVVTATVV